MVTRGDRTTAIAAIAGLRDVLGSRLKLKSKHVETSWQEWKTVNDLCRIC